MTAPLYYEDLAVGQTFGTGTFMVEPDMIKAFAAEFDPQPFHLDQDAARASLFGGLVASGWHTAAPPRLRSRELRIVGGLIGLGARIRWPRPSSDTAGQSGAGARPEIASRPWSGPGAEYNAEPGQQASDGHGRHHDRARRPS